jgi:S1-C subfamily serine protease
MVVRVLSGSGADEAGLRGARLEDTRSGSEYGEPGDVIVAIAGSPIESASDLAAYLAGASRQVGSVVTLRVVRGGEVLEVPVRLRARDATQADAL